MKKIGFILALLLPVLAHAQGTFTTLSVSQQINTPGAGKIDNPALGAMRLTAGAAGGGITLQPNAGTSVSFGGNLQPTSANTDSVGTSGAPFASAFFATWTLASGATIANTSSSNIVLTSSGADIFFNPGSGHAVIVSQPILPATTNTQSLGVFGTTFATAWFGGQVHAAEYDLTSGITLKSAAGLEVNSNVVPEADSTRNVGSVSRRYFQVFTDEVILGGNGTSGSGGTILSNGSYPNQGVWIVPTGTGGNLITGPNTLAGDLTIGGTNVTFSSFGNGPLSVDGSGNLSRSNWPHQTQATITSNQNITTNTETQVLWGQTIFDDGLLWSSGAPGVFTPVGGVGTRIRLSAAIRWQSITNGVVIQAKIKDNLGHIWAEDARTTASSAAGSPPGATLITPWISLPGGITNFFLTVEQDSGGTVALTSAGFGQSGATTMTVEQAK